MGLQREIPRKPIFIVVVCMIIITVVVDVSLCVSQPSSSVNDECVENTNQTRCVYLKQFRLSENKKVSVCAIEGAVRVNIRIFYNNQASIRGIWLNVSEWRTLLRLWGIIQSAMMKAENELD